MKGMTPYLTGFECNSVDGRGVKFNFILSNGDRSYQRDKGEKYSTHLMPEGAYKRIKSVQIYYMCCMAGFKFFDRDDKPIWQIGRITWSSLKVETVMLEDNEVIVGVVA